MERSGTGVGWMPGLGCLCYSHCPNVFLTINTLETQRGVKGILRPQTIRFPGPLLDILLKRRIRRPKRGKSGRVHNRS